VRSIVCSLLALAACADPVEVHTDVAKLAEVIQLPVRPTSATWSVAPRGKTGFGIGPTDHQLTAVLELSDADAETLAGTLERRSYGPAVEQQPWHPSEVGSSTVTYDATAFQRSPFRGGGVVRVSRTRFFVVLNTM